MTTVEENLLNKNESRRDFCEKDHLVITKTSLTLE